MTRRDINNTTFLKGIFGDKYEQVHVTDFKTDPNKLKDLPKMERLIAWKGDHFNKYRFYTVVPYNQYFTISLFTPDLKGIARRRKDLFLATYLIVLDDVKEKLSMDAVSLLPNPSYKIETSPGSEQWGYKLKIPCADRVKVENLVEGLINNGLAPTGDIIVDGKAKGIDPGMRGVTRYVRLPKGYNMKASKFINNKPFRCKLLIWEPSNSVSIEELASPFNVDLEASSKKTSRISGRKEYPVASIDIPYHPLLHSGLVVHDTRGDGRYDITCPWVNVHTNSIDDGTIVYTNNNGSPGFKCHHGSCQNRTTKHLLEYLYNLNPNFKEEYSLWQFKHKMRDTLLTYVQQ